MNVSLARIRSFAVIAEEKQFRKASEKLGLSQPALSTHIRDLERELGIALFSRTTRSVRLTVEGERFLHRVQALLHDLDAAVMEVRDQALLRRGRVMVAATPSVMANILPAAISAFVAKFPAVHVEIVEDSSDGVERRVQEGDVDFGIGPLPGKRSDLNFSFLVRDQFVGVIPHGHPLTNRRRVALRQLVGYPLISTRPETSIHIMLERALAKQGLHARTRYTVTQHQTVVSMVAAGLGVALLPAQALTTLDCSRVSITKIDHDIAREIGVLQRKGGESSSACKAFLHLLKRLYP